MANNLHYLIEVLLDPDSRLDPVMAEVEEREAVEDHLRAMGWDARRVDEPEAERLVTV